MKYFWSICVFVLALSGEAQQIEPFSSVLKEGEWLKLKTTEPGVYKITGADLKNQGIDISALDLQRVKVFGLPNGNMPQANNSGFPLDLQEMSVYVSSAGSTFSTSDYILFYSAGLHQFGLQENGSFHLEKDIYSKDYYTYVQLNSISQSKKITQFENKWDGSNVIEEYDRGQWYENELISILLSGREWYGEFLNTGDFSFEKEFGPFDYTAGSIIKIQAFLMGQSHNLTDIQVFLDGFELGRIVVPAIPAGPYLDKGYEVSGEYSVPSSLITSKPVLKVKFNPVKRENSDDISLGFVDRLQVQVLEPLSFESAQLPFRSSQAVDFTLDNYRITTSGTANMIWDCTDPFNVFQQLYSNGTGVLEFGSDQSGIREYIVFNSAASLKKPAFLGRVENQDLKGSEAVDFIIVSAPEFLNQAEELAEFRRMNDGLSVEVATTEMVYNEFSAGRPDPSAIRNYAKYMYQRSDQPAKLKYLLLFGKGSFDYKDFKGYGMSLVPIYQSRNSLSPLRTYGSDDYFSFLEDNEGEWLEFISGDHTSDIGVGRIPAISVGQASAIVSKLKHYARKEVRDNQWKTRVLFLADDGDGNLHHNDAARLADLTDTTGFGVKTKKVFLDMYTQEPGVNGEKSPEMLEALKREVQQGALVVNYSGHGNYEKLADEEIITAVTVQEWKNLDRLPLLVTATCEFGRHDNPLNQSAAELTLFQHDGGCVGLVTTTRVVYATTNFLLETALYNEMFKRENGENLRLGEIFRRTKNNSLNGVNNRNFSLLGDPSMKLAFPEKRVEVVSVENITESSDTLSALSKVLFKGVIKDVLSQTDQDFNGVVNVKVYDKKQSFHTLGDDNAPFEYKEWSSLLFSGAADVQNGTFEIEFIVPRNIMYDYGVGKVEMLATANDGQEAAGSFFRFRVGGSADGITDNLAPDLNLFMDDRNFISGDLTGRNPVLLVDVFDENGVSLTNLGVSQGFFAELDGGLRFDLAELYTSEINSYQSGTARLGLTELEPGRHNIKVSVRDVNGNLAEKSISFVVKDDSSLEILDVVAKPNPFSQTTTLGFRHSRTGEDLQVSLAIYTMQGKMLLENTYEIENAPATIDLKEWDGRDFRGESVENGMYIYTITVMSRYDGTKNRSYGKLIYMK